MDDFTSVRPELVGRERELELLEKAMQDAVSGSGSTIFISGTAGIGKSRLVDEFKELAGSRGARQLYAAAVADTLHPFLLMSKSLADEINTPLFEDREYMSFAEIFVINNAGLLVAQARPEGAEGLDPDIFAGMLSSVQNFVRDSFDSSGKKEAGLGRLEYGDLKILMEHGKHVFLTAVFKGVEHPGMRTLLRRTLNEIEDEHGQALEDWEGRMDDVSGIQDALHKLVKAKYLVRRDLEGVKLENERIRIADQVLDIFKGMSGKGPVVCILEDLHWADESSLFVLNYLARNLRDNKVLLLCTYRPGEGGALAGTLDGMRNEGLITEMELATLEPADVQLLLDSMYEPNEFPGSFVENVASQCGGNPFFLVETLRQMLEEGCIQRQNGTYVLTREDYAIPGTVEEMVHRKLDMLEPDAMAMAEYASCVGREFDRDAALSLPFVRDATLAFDRLRDSGLVMSTNGTVSFRQTIFQQQIYQGIGERWRSAYHKSLGEHYETAYGERDEVVYELARHFFRSREFVKAFDYCMRAAEKAEGAFAAEQAAEFYKGSLAVLPKLGMGQDAQGSEIDILERLGDIYSMTSDFQLAIDTYLSAIDKEEDARRMADLHCRISMVYEKMGEFGKSLAECDTGLGLIKDSESIVTSRLLNSKGATYNKIGEHEKASKMLSQGLRIARKFSDKKEIAKALHNIGNVHLFTSEWDNALENLGQALELWEEMEDIVAASRSINNIGVVYHSKGELDKALEYYERCLDIFNKIGDKFGISLVYNNIGNIYEFRGEFHRELEYYEKSLAIKKTIGDRHGIALSLMNIGCVYDDQGELDKALENLEESLGMFRDLGDKADIAQALNNIGDVRMEMGELDEALDRYSLAREMFETIGDKANLGLSLTNLGQISRLKGDIHGALELHEKSLAISLEIDSKWLSVNNYASLAEDLLESRDLEEAGKNAQAAVELAVELGSTGDEGMSRRMLGMVHREKGEPDAAVKQFEKGMAILEEAGEKGELGKLFYEYSLLHSKMGERAKAGEHMEKALGIFRSMGMKLWSEKAEEALKV